MLWLLGYNWQQQLANEATQQEESDKVAGNLTKP